MTFKCRASALGGLMTRLQNKTTLGKTSKKVVLNAVLLDVFDYRREIDAKMINKGLALEDDAIKAISLLKAVKLSKNTERRSNDWFSGECDLLTDDSIRDTKCSWSIDSFPWTHDDAVQKVKDGGYDWQGQVYMELWGKKVHYVDFVLLPTPHSLLGYNDDEYEHVDLVNRIPLQKRIRSVKIEYDETLIEQAKERVEMSRDYYNELFKQLSN